MYLVRAEGKYEYIGSNEKHKNSTNGTKSERERKVNGEDKYHDGTLQIHFDSIV